MKTKIKLLLAAMILVTSLAVQADTIGYWRFENAGTLGLDSSTNAIVLTAVGAPQGTNLPGALSGNPGALFPKTIPPLNGQTNTGGLQLDGASLLRRAAGAAVLVQTQFTAEAFFNVSSVPANTSIPLVSQWNNFNNQNGWVFSVREQTSGMGDLHLRIAASQNGTSQVISTNSQRWVLSANKDYYAAVTFNAGTITFYLADLSLPNPVLESETIASSITNIFNTSADFRVGAYGSSTTNIAGLTTFSGLIDEVRFSRAALAPTALLYPAPAAPLIDLAPKDVAVAEHADATFTSTASGQQPLSYQWYLGATAIAGATNTTLTLTNVSLTQNGTLYSVVVTNSVGSITSTPAVLTVWGPTIYYVAKTGSDTNSGTSLAAPFVTIQRAASFMVAGDTCYILKGTYRETVIPARSGISGARITFAPYQGESVIVSGADVLNLSWSAYSGSIYQATTTNSFNQLFVDGEMMNEARWPNAQVDRLVNIHRATVDSASAGNKSLTDAELPAVNLVGATIHVFPGNRGMEYVGYTRTITNYDTGNKSITWATALSDTINVGNPYYLFHSLSLLDVATEWYWDDAGDKLYLWTPDGASPASHIVEIKSRTSAFVLTNCSFITLTGLYVFAAGIPMSTSSANCIVDNCHLRYVQHFTTADGFNGGPDSKCNVSGSGSVWQNSSIMFSSQNGLRVDADNVVSNCVIRDADYFPGNYYSAIQVNGANAKIIGNTLANSGRFLILIKETPFEIAYNDMGYGQQLTKDGGAIYTYNTDGRGMAIHHNWVHDSYVGIYLDNASKNFFVYRNVCYDNSESGMRLNSPSINNLVYNNTLVRNKASFSIYGTNQAGSKIINNLGDGTMTFISDATTNKNGWFPPIGADFVPQVGSGAIDAGDIIPGVTDGYLGAAPDIGAYETGAPYWTPGASFSAPPFPTPESTSPPPTPAGLTALGTNNPLVNLSWTAPAVPVSYYNIKRSTTNGGPYTTITNVIAGASFTDIGVSTMTSYFYVVSAVNSTGESSNSSQANATPLAPIIVKDNADSGGITITGTWTASTFNPGYYGSNYIHDGSTGGVGGKSVRFSPDLLFAGSYEVYARWTADTNRATNVPMEVNYAAGKTTFSVNQELNNNVWVLLGTFNFNAGTNGNVTIRNDGANNYAIADAVMFVQVAGGSPPPAPTGLTATAVSSGQINLSWTASSGAMSYNVKRATVSGGPYTTIPTGVTITTYSDTGLTGGTTYYYVVSAVNAGGESTNSNEASATPFVIVIIDDSSASNTYSGTWTHSADTNYYNSTKSFSSTTGDYAQLTFTGNGIQVFTRKDIGLGMFDVYIDGMVNPMATNVDTYNPSPLYKQKVYENLALTNGSHTIRIKLNGQKNPSSTGYSIGLDYFGVQQVASLPPTLTGLTATAGNAQVALSWTASSGAASYNMKRATVNGGPYTTITNVTATSYTNTGLVNGTMYYFVVSATNSLGESPNSAEISARPTSFARPQVALAATANQFQVSWPLDHTGWHLQIQTNLLGTNWYTVSGATSTNSMSIPMSNNSSFFRLVYP
jgi:parallel beta-helix repeat protein